MSGAARERAAAAARAHAGGRRAPSGSALRPAASPVPDHRASPVPDPHLRGGRLGADLQQLLRAPGARCSAPQACGQRIGVDKGVGQLLGGSARHRGWGWEHRPGRGGSRALPPPAGRRPGRRAPGSSAEARSHRQASDGPAWSISAPVAGGRFRGLERLRKGPGGRGGGQGTQGGRPGKRTTRGGRAAAAVKGPCGDRAALTRGTRRVCTHAEMPPRSAVCPAGPIKARPGGGRWRSSMRVTPPASRGGPQTPLKGSPQTGAHVCEDRVPGWRSRRPPRLAL